jgi:hypothetical protein
LFLLFAGEGGGVHEQARIRGIVIVGYLEISLRSAAQRAARAAPVGNQGRTPGIAASGDLRRFDENMSCPASYHGLRYTVLVSGAGFAPVSRQLRATKPSGGDAREHAILLKLVQSPRRPARRPWPPPGESPA